MKEQSGTDKGPFTIYHENIPLTVPIHDKDRLALAYNMLYSMSENGAAVAVKGKPDITVMDNAYLYAKDNEGRILTPAPDPEWLGAQEKQIKERVLDGICKEEKEKTKKEPDREAVLREMSAYSICSYDNHDKVTFAPSTWDKDKAAEMFQFMCHGLNPSVSLFYDECGDFDEYGDEDEIDAYMTRIDTDTINSVCMTKIGASTDLTRIGANTNFYGARVIKAPEHEPDWAKNAMDEALKNRIYSFETPQLDESLVRESETAVENGFEM